MTFKPHPAVAPAMPMAVRGTATLAMIPAARLPRSVPHRDGRKMPTVRLLAMAAVWLTVVGAGTLAPMSDSAAQASAPAAAPRDFAAERKAIGDSRAWTNYRFATAERACYDKFFVTHCIDKAKEIQRGELQVLRQRELEVGEAERAQRAADRDREQALRRAEYEAGQPKRSANEQASRESFEKKQQEQQLRDAQHQADAPKRSANAQSHQQKQADYDARMREAQSKGAEQARQREENVKAYEAKQREAEQRQKDQDERRAKAKEQQGQASAPRPFGF
ncbi:hypothetical protein LMG31506_03101 [Cupriavidus yeoncheonensis]|uniref:Membrane protein involved in colicin uptake n=1 Tax=Cupriavidus yeoncheonensis TaxID=1462994 RepID=A0A916IVQ7_9BURK|nr:hypothetical protein [Cupriavidus yeoncheonensis]CAG2144920.1 hypothetical protein LMG31506_03101 [Cupriavidus yeoncheonensis]